MHKREKEKDEKKKGTKIKVHLRVIDVPSSSLSRHVCVCTLDTQFTHTQILFVSFWRNAIVLKTPSGIAWPINNLKVRSQMH